MSDVLPSRFALPSDSAAENEAGTVLRPRFSADGLIPAVVTDAETGVVVMFAHMNAEALALTIDTGVAHYWSRSRSQLWRKGESSGHEQAVAELRVDCDQDVVLLAVNTAGTGANCHTGRKSCFYRRVERGEDGTVRLRFDEGDTPRFDPAKIYGASS